MKIMAVDLGDARTGLAVCDRTEFMASPIGVIHEKNAKNILLKVAAAVVEYDVGEVIIGYPKNMNGTVGERAKKSEEFAKRLSKLVSVGVKLWDERSTTVSAHNVLNETNTRGQKRKDIIDEVAATIILESYLLYRKNQPKVLSVDRIEGSVAVCYDDNKSKFEFSLEKLPQNVQEGDIIKIDNQQSITIDEQLTQKRRGEAVALLQKANLIDN